MNNLPSEIITELIKTHSNHVGQLGLTSKFYNKLYHRACGKRSLLTVAIFENNEIIMNEIRILPKKISDAITNFCNNKKNWKYFSKRNSRLSFKCYKSEKQADMTNLSKLLNSEILFVCDTCILCVIQEMIKYYFIKMRITSVSLMKIDLATVNSIYEYEGIEKLPPIYKLFHILKLTGYISD